MSEVNGIATDPMAKVASVLATHGQRLGEHDRRIGDLEESKDKDDRERRNFTWVLVLQIALFILNMISDYIRSPK